MVESVAAFPLRGRYDELKTDCGFVFMMVHTHALDAFPSLLFVDAT